MTLGKFTVYLVLSCIVLSWLTAFMCIILSLLFSVFIKNTESVSCYSCTDVADDNVCTAKVTCGTGQKCSELGPGGIIGRRQTHDCLKCCSTDMCNKQLCQQTVHSGWSTWGSWGACSTTCDTGTQIRNRSCTNPQPDCIGTNTNQRLCHLGACPVGYWTNWSQWSKCSTTCGPGTRKRTRSCRHGSGCVGEPLGTSVCTQAPCAYFDCNERKVHQPNATDGVYDTILWKTNRTIQAYCDMTTDGGGWTVFQFRQDGSVDFFRNYSEYVHGFGDLHTEFWLGLDYLQEMVSHYQTDLRIDLLAANGSTAYEQFSPFTLSTNYVIHLGDTVASDNIDDKFPFGSFHNGSAFSASDHDADGYPDGDCAANCHGGFWYSSCYHGNLNGQYYTPGSIAHIKGIRYFSFAEVRWQSLKETKMSFRRTKTH